MEIGFQKQLHPVDDRERSHLYRFDHITPIKMVNNIAMLLDSEVCSNEGEEICLLYEEEIMKALQNSFTNVTTPTIKPSVPVAVISDNNEVCYW